MKKNKWRYKDYPMPLEIKLFFEYKRDNQNDNITCDEFYKELLMGAYHAGTISKEYHDKRIRLLYNFCHRKHLKEKQKEWDASHKELCLARYRRYHKRHKRKLSRRNKTYYRLHRTEILEHKRQKRIQAKRTTD